MMKAKLCTRCRNVYAIRGDMKVFVRNISGRKPDQLTDKQRFTLDKLKNRYNEQIEVECTCGFMIGKM